MSESISDSSVFREQHASVLSQSALSSSMAIGGSWIKALPDRVTRPHQAVLSSRCSDPLQGAPDDHTAPCGAVNTGHSLTDLTQHLVLLHLVQLAG